MFFYREAIPHSQNVKVQVSRYGKHRTYLSHGTVYTVHFRHQEIYQLVSGSAIAGYLKPGGYKDV